MVDEGREGSIIEDMEVGYHERFGQWGRIYKRIKGMEVERFEKMEVRDITFMGRYSGMRRWRNYARMFHLLFCARFSSLVKSQLSWTISGVKRSERRYWRRKG